MTDQAEQEGLGQAAQVTGAERKQSEYMVSQAVRAEFVKDGDVEGVRLFPSAEDTGLWQDLGFVSVPQRSQRKTVVVAALELFDIDPDSHPSLFRVAADDDAEGVPVVVEPPEPSAPVLKVG